MSGIRIDGALEETVKRDTVSLERFDGRIGYERANTTNKTTPFLLLNRCMGKIKDKNTQKKTEEELAAAQAAAQQAAAQAAAQEAEAQQEEEPNLVLPWYSYCCNRNGLFRYKCCDEIGRLNSGGSSSFGVPVAPVAQQFNLDSKNSKMFIIGLKLMLNVQCLTLHFYYRF